MLLTPLKPWAILTKFNATYAPRLFKYPVSPTDYSSNTSLTPLPHPCSARDIAQMVSQQLAADRGAASTAALKQLAQSSLQQKADQGSALFFTGRAVAEDQVGVVLICAG